MGFKTLVCTLVVPLLKDLMDALHRNIVEFCDLLQSLASPKTGADAGVADRLRHDKE
jgi:hypothetical protein